MIKSDLDNIEVPKNIDDTIDLAIDKIRKENIIKNKKRRTSKKVAMVASLVFVMGMSSIVIAKPAWAMDIPIIGDLIQKKLIDVNSKYKEYIQVVGQTKCDQGIDITFESAVADNNILNLSFVVKNNNESIKDNLTDALLIPTSLKVNGKSVSTGAGASWEVIDENTVRVLKNISWEYNELPDKLNMDIEISDMFGKKGDWNVSFALDVSDIRKNTYVEKLDRVINTNGIDFNLTEIVMTPLTTNIKGFGENKSGGVNPIDFMIIDNNGKEVKGGNSGSHADMTLERLNHSFDYINNTNSKTLNIIPYYNKHVIPFSEYGNGQIKNIEEKLAPTKINVEEFSKMNLKVNKDMSIDINNCIVDGEYLVVKYSYRYLDTPMTNILSAQIYVNADGEEVMNSKEYTDEENKKINELNTKYNEKNKENLVQIMKIGNSKDIEIGCYDGSSIEILKDQAFTVTKK
ncbi:DUF4179 domain-containing protein [Clostridium gasigenes]|uniref:DUF4179 domain-containing protein n=1 Tax=Clostridium gasigenes TaxID=94869 RepID=UPI001C0BA131|nr:DUF4179 domain-containing protein [Clostridium gasigenes]MBU3133210.1 DUF4179 domain-containing protein [Clostridium gasigenes]